MSSPLPLASRKLADWRLDLAAALVGVAAFFAFCDPWILGPKRIEWLLGLQDPAQSYLGWQFFRATSWWQLPLGLDPRFGSDLGSSIVFSDSLPLLALPLKLVRALLPPVFQFHGLWILACLALQGLVARRLLARFVDSAGQQLLGVGFFVLSPALLWRLHGHFSLLAQWILLAGLVLYFSPRLRRSAWLGLLALGILVHAYLFAMTAALWIADLFSRGRQGERRWRALLLDFALGTALSALLMAAVGYFVAGDAVTEGGFGHFRMNLLAPIDPDKEWSSLLPDLPSHPGEYEGFNYFGAGSLLLILAAAASRFLRSPRSESAPIRPLAPLVGLAALLLVYALSNRVYVGGFELAFYEVPGWLEGITGAFRASGRMFWPVGYLVLLLALVSLTRRWPERVAIGLLGLGLGVQAVDLAHAAGESRARFRAARAWRTPLVSPFWNAAASRYERIVVVPPANDPQGFLPLSLLAALHGMSINSGYYNRIDSFRLRLAVRREKALLEHDRIDPRALYVFRDLEGPFQRLQETRSAPDFAGRIDGRAVFAPGFGPVDPAWTVESESRAPAQRRPPRRRRHDGALRPAAPRPRHVPRALSPLGN